MIDEQKKTGLRLLPPASSSAALVLDPSTIDAMVRMSELMAKGTFSIPEQFRGHPADCLAVVMQAVQWKMNPFAVIGKTTLMHGRIGYEAQLVSAVIAAHSPIKAPLNYQWLGDWTKIQGKITVRTASKNGKDTEFAVRAWTDKDEEGLGVIVSATLKGETEPRERKVMLAHIRKRVSTNWVEDPQQQIAYYATQRWARLHQSGVIMGVYTSDELDDAFDPGEKDVTERTEAEIELPEYPQAQFDIYLPKWQKKFIDDADFLSSSIINKISLKYTMTDSQIKSIETFEALVRGQNNTAQDDADIAPMEAAK